MRVGGVSAPPPPIDIASVTQTEAAAAVVHTRDSRGPPGSMSRYASQLAGRAMSVVAPPKHTQPLTAGAGECTVRLREPARSGVGVSLRSFLGGCGGAMPRRTDQLWRAGDRRLVS